MAVQFINIGGERLAVMPVADYDRLVSEAEDGADIQAAMIAESRRREGEEYLPLALVDRLLGGDAPLRVWRQHRGLTLKALGEKAGISTGYLSQLEGGQRAGTPKIWRSLAAALDVTVDDILPHDPQ